MTAARGLAAILASGRRLTGLALRRGSGAAPRRPAPPGDSQMTQDAPRLVSGWAGAGRPSKPPMTLPGP
jgi:hypothetical protein